MSVWIILSLLVTVPTVSNSLEKEAREIEKILISPCCWTQPVSEHPSRASTQIKKEIRQLSAAGKTRQEILDYYVSRYGERILAKPRPQGFNLLAYVLPGAFLILGGWMIFVIFHKRLVTKPTQGNQRIHNRQIASSETDKQYETLLEEELRRLD